MKFTGKIIDSAIDFKSGKPRVTVEINEKNVFTAEADEYIAKDKIAVEIKEYRKSRSLDANSYCWVLINKLSDKLNVPPVEIYREAVRDIGGNTETVTISADAEQSFCRAWSSRGLGWMTEKIPCAIDGFVSVMVWYGSSVYDTRQMSRLIEIVVGECRDQGITTETPDEIARMVARWNDGQK